MRTTLKPITILATLLASVVALTACLHDDDDASGPAVPANGITITDANAETTMASATLTMGAILAAETTGGPADVMQLIVNRAKDAMRNPPATGQDPVVGVDFDDTTNCFGGGTIREVGSANGAASGSGSSTETFTNCVELGLTINGTLNISFSWNGDDWNANVSGSLTVNDGVEDITISGISLALNGNDNTGAEDFTVFQLTYDPAGGDGYAVQLTTTLEMNEFQSCPTTPTAGVIVITGAGGTQVRLTVTSADVMTLEFNDGTGTWTAVTNSPFTCATFFG